MITWPSQSVLISPPYIPTKLSSFYSCPRNRSTLFPPTWWSTVRQQHLRHAKHDYIPPSVHGLDQSDCWQLVPTAHSGTISSDGDIGKNHFHLNKRIFVLIGSNTWKTYTPPLVLHPKYRNIGITHFKFHLWPVCVWVPYKFVSEQ